MERFGRRRAHRGCGRPFFLVRLAVGATRQRQQHLARVLEIAPPQERGALAREAIRIVSRDVVIGDDHVLGRRPAFRAPEGRARLAVLGPVNRRLRAHARARHWISTTHSGFYPAGHTTAVRRAAIATSYEPTLGSCSLRREAYARGLHKALSADDKPSLTAIPHKHRHAVVCSDVPLENPDTC